MRKSEILQRVKNQANTVEALLTDTLVSGQLF